MIQPHQKNAGSLHSTIRTANKMVFAKICRMNSFASGCSTVINYYTVTGFATQKCNTKWLYYIFKINKSTQWSRVVFLIKKGFCSRNQHRKYCPSDY